MMSSTILQIETLAANAWPAAEIAQLDGWLLRATSGVTGRANSVWPNQTKETLPLERKLSAVEEFYQQRNLPPRFQISPACQPTNLDDLLAQRGYTRYDHVAVQTATLASLNANTPPLRLTPEFDLEICEEFDEDWFALYCQAEQVTEPTASVRRAILQRIAPPRAFATLRIDQQPAAIALGVLEQGWLGVFNVETKAEFRRRGAASALLRTLTIWAQMQGATNAYLQVVASNTPAKALYEKIGFATLYHYYYRIKHP